MTSGKASYQQLKHTHTKFKAQVTKSKGVDCGNIQDMEARIETGVQQMSKFG